MNRAYRSIWNQALGVWVAISELASARGKPGKAKLLGAVTLAMVSLVHSHGAHGQASPYNPDGGIATDVTGIAIGPSSLAAGAGATLATPGTGGAGAIAIGSSVAATGANATAIGTGAKAAGSAEAL